MTEVNNPQQREIFSGLSWSEKIRDRLKKPQKAFLIESPKAEGKMIDGYYNPEMANSENTIMAVIDRFAAGFKSERYGLIIADDSSARLPGLVLKKVSSEISKKEGVKPVPLFFIDAGAFSDRAGVKEQVSQLLNKINELDKRRALIITEYMNTGDSMRYMSESLKEFGIESDIAALEAAQKEYNNINLSSESTLFIAKLRLNGDSPLHNRPFLTGLTREKGTNKLTPLKNSNPNHQAANMEMVKRARQDVNLMAKRAIARVYPEPQSQA